MAVLAPVPSGGAGKARAIAPDAQQRRGTTMTRSGGDAPRGMNATITSNLKAGLYGDNVTPESCTHLERACARQGDSGRERHTRWPERRPRVRP